MFFVTAGHKLYGPYWHKGTATEVQSQIITHYTSLGIPAMRVGDKEAQIEGPIEPIVVGIVDRQMIREADGWKDHEFGW